MSGSTASTSISPARVISLLLPPLAVMALIIRGAETNERGLTQWSPGFWAIGSGLRQLHQGDEAYVADVARLLDGLYRFCQDLLAPAARPAPVRRE